MGGVTHGSRNDSQTAVRVMGDGLQKLGTQSAPHSLQAAHQVGETFQMTGSKALPGSRDGFRLFFAACYVLRPSFGEKLSAFTVYSGSGDLVNPVSFRGLWNLF